MVLPVKTARKQYARTVLIGQDDFCFLRKFYVNYVQINYQNQKN
jgi:hypothetical protein